MKLLATIASAAFALVVHSAFAGAQAANSSGHCTGVTVTDYLTSDFDDHTTSTTFQNLTDGHLNVTTSTTGCVMITFSGFAEIYPQAAVGEALRVRTLLDGNNLCYPAYGDDTFLEGSAPATAGAHSITRICKNVTAGAHTVQVQYRSSVGGAVEIAGHMLTIAHN